MWPVRSLCADSYDLNDTRLSFSFISDDDDNDLRDVSATSAGAALEEVGVSL